MQLPSASLICVCSSVRLEHHSDKVEVVGSSPTTRTLLGGTTIMEILEICKGHARVEFMTSELQEYGDFKTTIAVRLDDDVHFRIKPPIDYDKKRDVWILELRLWRYVSR